MLRPSRSPTRSCWRRWLAPTATLHDGRYGEYVVVHESADLRIERFEINSVNGQRVPGLLLAPVVASSPLPTLLVAHPATLDKAADYVLAPAEDWARRGAVCVTIDQAGHGERASGAAAMESFRDP